MRKGIFMKRFSLGFITILISFNVLAAPCEQGDVEIASCMLKGKVTRQISFCEDSETKNINYTFKRNGKVELNVLFNNKNKLQRWVDKATYTTYIGFSKGAYDYVLGVPQEGPGVVAFFDIKKNGENIQSSDCVENSFGDESIKSDNIIDVPDGVVRDSGFKFPQKLN